MMDKDTHGPMASIAVGLGMVANYLGVLPIGTIIQMATELLPVLSLGMSIAGRAKSVPEDVLLPAFLVVACIVLLARAWSAGESLVDRFR